MLWQPDHSTHGTSLKKIVGPLIAMEHQWRDIGAKLLLGNCDSLVKCQNHKWGLIFLHSFLSKLKPAIYSYTALLSHAIAIRHRYNSEKASLLAFPASHCLICSHSMHDTSRVTDNTCSNKAVKSISCDSILCSIWNNSQTQDFRVTLVSSMIEPYLVAPSAALHDRSILFWEKRQRWVFDCF